MHNVHTKNSDLERRLAITLVCTLEKGGVGGRGRNRNIWNLFSMKI